MREASEKIEVIPAKYEWAEQRLLVKEASEKLVEVPAEYDVTQERVEIEPAHTVWRTGSRGSSKEAHPTDVAAAIAIGLPASPQAGQCFAQFYEPARYDSKTEQVVAREASEKIDVTPARYEWSEQRVVVKEASEKIVEVPAQYDTVTERVLETPASTSWKVGRGPIERIDNMTGEIMCLIEVPAKYKTVKKRVLKTPAVSKKVQVPAEYKTERVRKLVSAAQENRVAIPAEYQTITKRMKVADARVGWRPKGTQGVGDATGKTLCLAEVPAKYKTVKKRVVKRPAQIKKVEIPGEYKTVRVRKLISPAQEKRIAVPAEYQTVTKRAKVTDARQEWRSVLCETNTSETLVTDIQRALQRAGFNPGPIDGVIGRQTMVAVDEFQQRKSLPRGGLTMSTIDALGVAVR